MVTTKTAISLNPSLLLRLDRAARELDLPRSRVLARAAEEFLGRHENEVLLAQINRVCAQPPSEKEKAARRAMRSRMRRVAETW